MSIRSLAIVDAAVLTLLFIVLLVVPTSTSIATLSLAHAIDLAFVVAALVSTVPRVHFIVAAFAVTIDASVVFVRGASLSIMAPVTFIVWALDVAFLVVAVIALVSAWLEWFEEPKRVRGARPIEFESFYDDKKS